MEPKSAGRQYTKTWGCMPGHQTRVLKSFLPKIKHGPKRKRQGTAACGKALGMGRAGGGSKKMLARVTALLGDERFAKSQTAIVPLWGNHSSVCPNRPGKAGQGLYCPVRRGGPEVL